MSLRNHWGIRPVTSSLLIAAMHSATASAQSTATAEPPDMLGEIVVTATRQEERLSRVPISIAAFTQEALDEQGVRRIDDIARLTPGLTLTRSARGNSTSSNLSIRGISSGAGSATTGVYIDETPVQIRPASQNASDPFPRVFDLERVEVLRGPQGTLFGAGSQGGTVRFITPTPSLTQFSSYSRAEVASVSGDDISYEGGVALGGPLVADRLGLRVSGWVRRDGGFVDRVSLDNQRVLDADANWSEAHAARVSLRFAATDALSITPSIHYQRVHTHDAAQYWEQFSDRDDSDFRNGSPVRAPNTDEFTLASLKIDWSIGSTQLVSNTSFLHRNNSSIYDSTTLDTATLGGFTQLPPPPPADQYYSWGDLRDEHDFFTQEVRLQNADPNARLNWVVGAFVQRNEQKNHYYVINPFLTELLRANPFFVSRFGPNVTPEQLFGVGLFRGTYLLFTEGDIRDEQDALFAQADYDVTDRLKLIAGVRYAQTQYVNKGFGAGPVLRSNSRITDLDQEEEPVTPKFGVQYQINDSDMVYVSAAKGFRIGGATPALPASCTADATALGLDMGPRAIKSDSVWSYEIGSKGRLLNNRVQFDGSVFRIDWEDIQSGFNLPNCNIPTSANLGKARSQGFDLAVQAQVTDKLLLSVAAGYTDAEFTETSFGAVNPNTGRPGIIRSKGQPLEVPPWSLSLSSQYDFVAFGRDAYLRADYQYQSQNDTAPDLAAGADPTLERTPSSSNLDLRLGATFNGFDISLFAANVTDQHPEYGTYRETLATSLYHSFTVRPRTFGVTATHRF